MTVCHMPLSKAKVTEVRKLQKLSITKSISSACYQKTGQFEGQILKVSVLAYDCYMA